MPRPKDDFDDLYPFDIYTADELLNRDQMYSVNEIARLLQGLDLDANIDESYEEVLLDWAIPWILNNSEDLMIAESLKQGESGYYGVKTDLSDTGSPLSDNNKKITKNDPSSKNVSEIALETTSNITINEFGELGE